MPLLEFLKQDMKEALISEGFEALWTKTVDKKSLGRLQGNLLIYTKLSMEFIFPILLRATFISVVCIKHITLNNGVPISVLATRLFIHKCVLISTYNVTSTQINRDMRKVCQNCNSAAPTKYNVNQW